MFYIGLHCSSPVYPTWLHGFLLHRKSDRIPFYSYCTCLEFINIHSPFYKLISSRGKTQIYHALKIKCFIRLLLSQATDYKMMYMSRLLVGISHALSTTTVYTVEILSNDLRGPCDIMISSFR